MRKALIMFIATVIGCNNIQNNSGSLTGSTITSADSSKTTPSLVETDFTHDSVLTIKFPKDSSSITISGKMKGINNPVTVNIPVTTGSQLIVSLNPEDSTANIRINQVFTPDGKADGPFGKTLNRKINQQGNYKLIIGENLMQGDEWKGKFKLLVRVK